MGRMKLSFFLHAEIFNKLPKTFFGYHPETKPQNATRQSQYLSLHNE